MLPFEVICWNMVGHSSWRSTSPLLHTLCFYGLGCLLSLPLSY
ncbi:unnamed protein product [Prunus brigantina]